MKKILLLTAILSAAYISHAQFTSAKITAAGLTCAMCTRAIYNALEKVPAIDKVDADISTSSFLIRFKNGAAADPDAVKKAVEDAGFSISKMTLTGRFNHLAIDKHSHVNIGDRTFHFIELPKPVTLDGEQTLRLVDRNFVSAREFKKYETAEKHPCLESGRRESCCPAAVTAMDNRIYHVTL